MLSGSSRGQGGPASSQVLSGAGGKDGYGTGAPGEHPALPRTPGLKASFTCTNSEQLCKQRCRTGAPPQVWGFKKKRSRKAKPPSVLGPVRLHRPWHWGSCSVHVDSHMKST